MKKDPESSAGKRGHPIHCAYCKAEITGTPYEKNGNVYDSEEHANADDKHAPRT